MDGKGHALAGKKGSADSEAEKKARLQEQIKHWQLKVSKSGMAEETQQKVGYNISVVNLSYFSNL